MTKRVDKTEALENVTIAFRNFTGAAGKFSPAGKRTFSVFLSPEDADRLAEIGWNVKCLMPVDDDTPPQCHIPVEVNFRGPRPPRIILISGEGKTRLDETTINILDWADIETADVILSPYNWEVNGATGVKAYLDALYVVIREDEFERKYYDVPDSAQNSVGIDLGLDVSDMDSETY